MASARIGSPCPFHFAQLARYLADLFFVFQKDREKDCVHGKGVALVNSGRIMEPGICEKTVKGFLVLFGFQVFFHV